MRGSHVMGVAVAILGAVGVSQGAITAAKTSGSAWVGTPTIAVTANATGTVNEDLSSAVWGQSFSVTQTGTLSSIQLGIVGAGAETLTVQLIDVGTSNPTSYTTTSASLLTTSTAALDNFASAGSEMWSFTGADAVSLTAGHTYVFQLTAPSAAYFYRSPDSYAGGSLFKAGSLLNGTQRDANMAVTIAVPEPGALALLGASALLVVRRRRRA